MVEPLSTWLAMREPADTAARSGALTQAIVDALPADRPLRILDLGTGTGSNIRFLAARLPSPRDLCQDWTAVDRDPVLLAQVPAYATTRCIELGSLEDPGLFSGRHLVSASALLDLVSASWMAALAARCRYAGAAALFALNYDGRSACHPSEPEDGLILELFNRHQRISNKGFGVAVGPDAADCAVRCFSAAGYRVQWESSDWDLAPGSADLQRALIAGWAEAAGEIAPERRGLIRSWLARRLNHVERGCSRIQVGHQDVAAWLP